MTFRSIACFLVPCLLALSARSARAGEQESRSLFAEARTLRQQGKCTEAIVLFRKAYETYPDGLGALRNVAECETELGKLASARRDWSDLKIAVLRSTSPKYEGWEKDAADAYAALDARVARIRIELDGERTPGLRLKVNGQPFDLRLVGVELEEDQGPLVVEALVEGSAPKKRVLDVKEAMRETIRIEVPPPHSPTTSPSSAPSGSAQVEPPPPPSSSRTGMRVAGGVSVGVGAAGLAGMLASIGVRQSALSAVDAVCPSRKHCPASVSGDVSRGKTASTLVDVFAVTAGVGTALGVGLLVGSATSSSRTDARPVALELGIGPASLSLGGTFR
jgi:hypothetical protein